uniref:Uncharacterized protein n=1 Tax=Magallana gigas TaxID=29159 RepID=A0A8W8P183_MAGGI
MQDIVDDYVRFVAEEATHIAVTTRDMERASENDPELCLKLFRVSVSQPSKPEPMKRNELPSAPWQHLAANLLGPLPNNDPRFVSQHFKDFMLDNGIVHHRTTPLWLQANGEVIAHAEGRDWKAELDKFLVMYRNTPHTTTGVSPSQLLFGRKLRKLPELLTTMLMILKYPIAMRNRRKRAIFR